MLASGGGLRTESRESGVELGPPQGTTEPLDIECPTADAAGPNGRSLVQSDSLAQGPVQFSEWSGGIQSLPPLPTPNRMEMCTESMCGIVVVLGQVILYLVLANAVTLPAFTRAGNPLPGVACVVLLFVFAAIAIVCLVGILCGNPGEIRRSPDRCFPLPADVATQLRHGNALSLLHNIQDTDQTYCVRCLVWRRPALDGTAHHCQTCQRCVRNFDHHCGVFGRCIAGKCWPPSELLYGNMRFFATLLCMAVLSAPTCFGFLIAALRDTS